MSAPPTVLAALTNALAADPGRPLVTFYDDATGERIELSVTTFDNWVSKIANLYVDELMLDRGDVVRVSLPTHWQSTVAIAAAWVAGLAVDLDGSTTPQVSVVGPDAVASHDQPEGRVVACSLRPLGARFLEPLPPGWLDFAVDVPAQPDALLAPVTVDPGEPALHHAGHPISHADLVSNGLRAAEDAGLEPGGRLLTDLNPARSDDVALTVVAPLVTGSSVVLLTHASADRAERVAEQEQVSCRALADTRA